VKFSVGPPAVLDHILGAAERTLILAADDSATAAAAGAVLTQVGAALTRVDQQTRSLPTTVRGADGVRREYGDPRLQREVGVKSTVARLGLSNATDVAAVVGSKAKELGSGLDMSGVVDDPISSASGVVRALAELVETSRSAFCWPSNSPA